MSISGIKGRIKYPLRHKYFLLTQFLLPLTKNKNPIIIDYGCGSGHDSISLSGDFGYTVVGVDISKKAIKNAHKNPRVHFVVADSTKLPLKDNAFDGLYSCDVLGHIPDFTTAITEIHRVLKSSGIVAIFSESIRTRLVLFENYVISKAGYNIIDQQDMHVSIFPRDRIIKLFKSKGLNVLKSYSPYLVRFIFYPDWYEYWVNKFGTKPIIATNMVMMQVWRNFKAPYNLFRTLYFYLELFTIGRVVETSGLFLKAINEK